MKYYAIKRPDGSWVMAAPDEEQYAAWRNAGSQDHELWAKALGRNRKGLEELGYRCVEVSGFVEVEK